MFFIFESKKYYSFFAFVVLVVLALGALGSFFSFEISFLSSFLSSFSILLLPCSFPANFAYICFSTSKLSDFCRSTIIHNSSVIFCSIKNFSKLSFDEVLISSFI
ncbi:MAG: hypothetical protein WCG25_09995 [bacterium]